MTAQGCGAVFAIVIVVVVAFSALEALVIKLCWNVIPPFEHWYHMQWLPAFALIVLVNIVLAGIRSGSSS